MDLVGGLAEESRNEEPTCPASAIRTAGGKAAAVLLAWLHASKGQGSEPFGPLGVEPPRQSIGMNDASASQQIDAIVRKTSGWRGERPGPPRAFIKGAHPRVIERGKGKKPPPPRGGPVWAQD